MPDLPPPPANPRRYSASQLPPDADPAEKEFIGLLAKALAPSYMLIRRLGAGGMGTVYVARDPVLKRLVAVKVMSPELSRDPDARSRFSREAQAVAAISHPNVVAVYAVGELENGLPYIVMQYVEGRSMQERIAEDGPLDVPAAKRILGEVASALAATHKKGIIHRDIKPANILWDDEAGRALVTDFGIAAVREHPDERGRDATKITQVGMSVGTPAYMSPEQFLAEVITDKTDIYALGLLGYELLIGEGPYAATSPAQMMASHLRDEPRPLSTLRSEVDAELEGLLAKCLAKDPLQRPMAQYIAEHLQRGVGALLEWPPPGLEDFARRYNSIVLSLTVAGLLIGIPLVALSTMDLDDTLRRAMPSAGALVVLTSLGFLALLVSAVNMASLFMRARLASKRGYGWLTMLEAMCDDRGDAGALIAGGREYAALSPAERNSLRVNRMVAGGMRLAGALTPMLGYVVGLLVAVRMGAGVMWLVLMSLFLSFALLVLARASYWMEEWKLRKSRQRLALARKLRTDNSALGESWTATFESVRGGQRVGAGIAKGGIRSPYLQYGIAVSVAVLIGGACTLAYATAAIGSVSELFFDDIGGLNTGNIQNRLRKVARLAKLRLPVDSSVTPLQAGQLLVGFTPVKVPAWSSAAESHLVRDARRLSAATRDTLRTIAAEPQLPKFRMFARARTFDYLGARMPLEQLDSMSFAKVPLPKYTGLRSLVVANFAAGVLAMSDGRNADAEQRFKELLTAGFLLIREGTLIETLVGRTMVDRARQALAVLYEQTGRQADAVFVSESSDPPDAEVASGRQLMLDQRQAHYNAIRTIKDKDVVRGIRTENLFFPLAYGPCGDLKQVIFGVDPAYTETLAAVRKELTRFPSDSVWFDKVTHALDRPMKDGFGNSGFGYQVLAPIARAVDFLTGSKRMQSCASMLS